MWKARRYFLSARDESIVRDPVLLRRRQERKVIKATSSLISTSTPDVDKFLLELDEDLAEARNIIDKSDALSATTWIEVKKKAEDRGVRSDELCPICLQSLGFEQGRDCVVLSCSHLFHSCCLNNLEQFSSHPNMGQFGRCCPVCRTSSYSKKAWH